MKMKHRVRFKSLFALAVVAILLLAACGKKTPTPTAEAVAQPAVTEEVETKPLDEELVEAVESGDAEEVERLLGAGADPMAPTPLGPLPSLAALKGDPDILGLLGQHGADLTMPSLEGLTPLQIAVGNGNLEAMNTLLDLGIDPNIMGGGDIGGTPLLSAIEGGQFEAIELLLERGADPNLANLLGETPLLSAVDLGNIEIAELLIANEVDLDLPNLEGETPLLSAVDLGNLDMAELLIESGVDLDLPDVKGDTALHLAALNEDLEMLKLLIESGADFSILNDAGQLPIDLGEIDFDELFSDLNLDIDLDGLLPDTGN
jgi:ankyrin repeat protein/predicted small lipoprotein YifL